MLFSAADGVVVDLRGKQTLVTAIKMAETSTHGTKLRIDVVSRAFCAITDTHDVDLDQRR